LTRNSSWHKVVKELITGDVVRNSRRYFFSFAVVLLVLVALVASFVLPAPKPEVTSAPRLVPQMFALVVAKEEGGNVDIRTQGTGILIDRERGHLVTAKHVILSHDEYPGYVLYAIVDGVRYPLEVIWRHTKADVAILRFSEKTRPTTLPRPLSVNKKLPATGSTARLLGYLYSEKKSEEFACEWLNHPFDLFVCEKGVALEIEFVDASMADIAIGTAITELLKFIDFVLKHPEVKIGAEDFLYDSYITARPKAGSEKDYHGMSGGALVDTGGTVFAIFVSFTDERLTFIPAREIPDEYLPHPSH